MDDKTTDMDIAALEAMAKALEDEANKTDLTPEEKRRAEALDRIQAAKETVAANAKRRREAAMALREAAILKTLEDGALVKALDLYSYFPLGAKPAHMPSGGFIVLRNPQTAAAARTHGDVEAREKQAHEIATELIVSCLEYPTETLDAQEVRSFLETYIDATIQIAGEARALNGAKSRERPRGRG